MDISTTTRLMAYKRDAHHVGGKIIIGPDKNLYIIVGDGLDHLYKGSKYLIRTHARRDWGYTLELPKMGDPYPIPL